MFKKNVNQIHYDCKIPLKNCKKNSVSHWDYNIQDQVKFI